MKNKCIFQSPKGLMPASRSHIEHWVNMKHLRFFVDFCISFCFVGQPNQQIIDTCTFPSDIKQSYARFQFVFIQTFLIKWCPRCIGWSKSFINSIFQKRKGGNWDWTNNFGKMYVCTRWMEQEKTSMETQ